MPIGRSIIARLGMDSTEVRSELVGLNRKVQRFARRLARIGFTAAVAGMALLARSAMQLGSRLADSAENLDISVEALQVFERQAQETGASADTVFNILRRLNRSLNDAAAGAGTARQDFANLGIEWEDLTKIPLEERLEQVARGIFEAEDQMAAMSAASRLLGERNLPQLRTMLERLATDGFGTLENRVRETWGIMDTETARALDQAQIRIDAFRSRMTIAFAETLKNIEGFTESTTEAIAEFFNINRADRFRRGLIDTTLQFRKQSQEIASQVEQQELSKEILFEMVRLQREYEKISNSAMAVDMEKAQAIQIQRDELDRMRRLVIGLTPEELQRRKLAKETAESKEDEAEAQQKIVDLTNTETAIREKMERINRTRKDDNRQIELINRDIAKIKQDILASTVEEEEGIKQILSLIRDRERIQDRINQKEEQSAERAREERISRAEILADLKEEMAILRARASGDEERAKALEDEARVRRLTQDIVEATGMTEERANHLARERVALENQIRDIRQDNVELAETEEQKRLRLLRLAAQEIGFGPIDARLAAQIRGARQELRREGIFTPEDARAALKELEGVKDIEPFDFAKARREMEKDFKAEAKAKVEAEKPDPVKPKVEEPEPIKPRVETPDTVKPEIEQPEKIVADVKEPDPVKPKVEEPEPIKPSVETPDTVKPQVDQPEKIIAEVEQPDPVKPTVEKPEPAKIDVEKPEPIKPEIEKPEAVEAESRFAHGVDRFDETITRLAEMLVDKEASAMDAVRTSLDRRDVEMFDAFKQALDQSKIEEHLAVMRGEFEN